MLGFRGANIFYFSCEHPLFAPILKQKQTKFPGLKKNREFSKFKKIEFSRGKFWKTCSSINHPWGHVRSHNKFVPDRFFCFDVHWIQTNKQTPIQTDKHQDKPNL